jgi:hypothetical protein
VSSEAAVFVDTTDTLDEVAEAVRPAIGGRAFMEDSDGRNRALFALRDDASTPWVSVHLNGARPIENRDGHEITSYEYEILLSGPRRDEVARAIFDALRARGYRLLFEDSEQEFIDQHDPEERKSAAG